MNAVVVNDVTKIIAENFLVFGNIIIPPKIDFNHHFGDPKPGKKKFLQIKTDKRKYNIIQDDYNHEIVIKLDQSEKQIKLIYFVYIDRASNWREIVEGQLTQLNSYGLLDEVDLYVQITDQENMFVDIEDIIVNICSNVTFARSNANHYEYEAIKLVYDLAKRYPDSNYIYLHTKGMSYNLKSRYIGELALLTGTFENWRKKMEAFNNPQIKKIGLFIGDERLEKKAELQTNKGWIWFNFWYAKGSYIVDNCLEPKPVSDRYYWEVWLAGPISEYKNSDDCYSLYKQRSNVYMNADEACEGLTNVANSLKIIYY